MTQKDIELPIELIETFVGVAHSNLEQVRTMLEAEPKLLTAVNSLGETALGAAAHMGREDIALYLLEQGATADICTAAMLGQTDQVAQFLDNDPSLASAKGAHGIPLMFHAALSGKTAVSHLILSHGGNNIETALHGAVKQGHVAMTKWLLARGARTDLQDFRARTPLEVAVEREDEAITAVLQTHIGLENLVPCPNCGERGWRIVVSVTGNRFAEGQTAVYQCQRCQAPMGQNQQKVDRATT